MPESLVFVEQKIWEPPYYNDFIIFFLLSTWGHEDLSSNLMNWRIWANLFCGMEAIKKYFHLLSTFQILFLFGSKELQRSVVHQEKKSSYFNRVYICPNSYSVQNNVCIQVLKNTRRFSIGGGTYNINNFIVNKQVENFEYCGHTLVECIDPDPLTLLH